MEYITYAHILNGQVFQIGDFGAVALWYLTRTLKTRLIAGCHLVRTWTISLPSLKVGCGDYSIRFFNEFFPLLNSTKYKILGTTHD